MLQSHVTESLTDTPVVLIAGPRQAGKTTLVCLVAKNQGLHYLTLDDEVVLLAAKEDPVGMIRNFRLPDPVALCIGTFYGVKPVCK